MHDNAGRLEVLCLKPYLNKDEVLSFLSGYENSQGDGYNERAFTDLITGEKLLLRKAKGLMQRCNDVKAIWEASKHSKPDKELELDPTHVDLMVPKEYLHKWVKQRGNTGASFPKVFCWYRECLRVALEKRWVVVKDLEVSSLGTGQTPDCRQAKRVKRQDSDIQTEPASGKSPTIKNASKLKIGYFDELELWMANYPEKMTAQPFIKYLFENTEAAKRANAVEICPKFRFIKYENSNGVVKEVGLVQVGKAIKNRKNSKQQ